MSNSDRVRKLYFWSWKWRKRFPKLVCILIIQNFRGKNTLFLRNMSEFNTIFCKEISWLPIYIYIYIYIYIIIIIIMLCRQRGYPWPSLTTSPYHSSPPAGLQGYILCPHIVAVCKFELVVLLLHGHMWGSIGVHHLWARPCFSSSEIKTTHTHTHIYIYIYW